MKKRKLRELLLTMENGVFKKIKIEHIDTIDLCDKFLFLTQGILYNQDYVGLRDCDGDGTIARNLNNESLQLCNINKSFKKMFNLCCKLLGFF